MQGDRCDSRVTVVLFSGRLSFAMSGWLRNNPTRTSDPHSRGTQMLKNTGWGLAVLSAVLLGNISPSRADEKPATKKKDFAVFGTLSAPSEVKVRLDAANWLKET